MDETAHVAAALLQVEHDIADPLARTVIGVPSPAPRLDDIEPRIEQFGAIGTGPGRIDRGMFEQPDQFARCAFGDRMIARSHAFERGAVVDPARLGAPFDGFG